MELLEAVVLEENGLPVGRLWLGNRLFIENGGLLVTVLCKLGL